MIFSILSCQIFFIHSIYNSIRYSATTTIPLLIIMILFRLPSTPEPLQERRRSFFEKMETFSYFKYER